MSGAIQDQFCACPGLGYSPAAMIVGWLYSFGRSPDWLKVPDRQVLLTHQGRTGLGLLCHMLRLGPADEVLLPAYNCGAEVDPFVHAGCKVVFYRIDQATGVDVSDIRNRLSKATRLVYVTHYFGWPQDMGGLADLCKQRNVLLIEDCAQALFSGSTHSQMGKLGDAVIYSFVKSLAVPDGGALILGQKLSFEVKAMRFPHINCTLLASLPLFKKWFMQKNAFWQRYAWCRQLLNRSWIPKPDRGNTKGRPEMLSSNCFDESRRFWLMSRVSGGVLKKTNIQELVARRRRNFAYLHEHLKNHEYLRPLHQSLPGDVCPLSYPVYAKDPVYSQSYLEKKGILIQGWPGYYPGMPWADYPDACVLKDTLLTLPVHQDLSLEQMEYIAKCANSLGKHAVLDIC